MNLLLAIILSAVVSAVNIPQMARSGTSGYTYNRHDHHKGPKMWGKLSEEFEQCKKGRSQSPINIDTSNEKKPHHMHQRRPRSKLYTCKLQLVESTFNWALLCPKNEDCGYTTFGGKKYDFVGFHFHGPSEHTIDGKHSPLEMHMVHRSKDGSLAVLATLFRVVKGRKGRILDDILHNVHEHKKKVEIDLSKLLKRHNGYHVYKGSLTTPPCTEGVVWMVARKKLVASREQVEDFKKTAHSIRNGNNRPLQKTNGRTVSLYGFFN